MTVNLKMEKKYYGTMYFNKKVSKSGYWVDGKFKNKINFPVSFYASSLLNNANSSSKIQLLKIKLLGNLKKNSTN